MACASHGLISPAQHDDSRSFFGIFLVSFVVFLVFALVAGLLTGHLRSWLPGAESEKSLIGGVKAAVYTFMSHLT
ncbi:MAG: hypothetical protein CVU30_11215 [Betaproteobacteria bacterium HGW-Betaproteobacteria-3]|jgi:light-harvesting complex 1 beta chain|nr:MAG: hypothetical protein CVU30_11215 [Betaproteobacteria bacterium HGW-Betaproteobacteria-3]